MSRAFHILHKFSHFCMLLTEQKIHHVNSHPLSAAEIWGRSKKFFFVKFPIIWCANIKYFSSNIEQHWILSKIFMDPSTNFHVLFVTHASPPKQDRWYFIFTHSHTHTRAWITKTSKTSLPSINPFTPINPTSTNCFVVNFTAVDNNNEWASEWERKLNLRLKIRHSFSTQHSTLSNQYI